MKDFPHSRPTMWSENTDLLIGTAGKARAVTAGRSKAVSARVTILEAAPRGQGWPPDSQRECRRQPDALWRNHPLPNLLMAIRRYEDQLSFLSAASPTIEAMVSPGSALARAVSLSKMA